MKENIRLGQVFTEKDVAELMVDLIYRTLDTHSKCLDPCIGKNIFLTGLSKHVDCEMYGVETDESLVDKTTTDFFQNNKRKLFIMDFFDFHEGSFDAIIMNPPYVRQELLDSKINSKKKIKDALGGEYDKFSKKSNLYIYFIVKALKQLYKDKYLVAIIYDSWLFTDFGAEFKKYILSNYNLKKIIHFRHGAFEKVNVGATILLIQNQSQKEPIEYCCLKSPKDLTDEPVKYEKLSVANLYDFSETHGNHVDFKTGIFTKLSSLSNIPIRRGMSAKINKYFLFDTNRYPDNTQKIVKSVTKVKSFSVNNDYSYILIAKDVESEELKRYLDSVKKEILSSDDNKILKKEIAKNKNWWRIKEQKQGNVIFNYYMRDNIHFIYNNTNCLVADNFYNLQIVNSLFENLAILNSTLTKYALMKFSKSQGHGLFKIQLNRFNEVPVVDITKFDESSIQKLRELGEDLIKVHRYKSDSMIEKIDKVIIVEINKKSNQDISISEIKEFIENIKEV